MLTANGYRHMLGVRNIYIDKCHFINSHGLIMIGTVQTKTTFSIHGDHDAEKTIQQSLSGKRHRESIPPVVGACY